jgi:folate-dependent tRNA-U54 methylase TrmFO/GidA
VLSESIDQSKVFRQSRWDRSLREAGSGQLAAGSQPACGTDDGQGDYLNCPMAKDEYDRFYDALVAAESATVHDFDKATFFEGCLPIEVMAHRGRDTLRFGPMKPVGLVDPRTGRRPYAVVQLRQDTLAGDHWSLVGLPDANQVGRPVARAAADPGARVRRVRSASAWCIATPTSTVRPCCATRGRPARAPTSSSRAR